MLHFTLIFRESDCLALAADTDTNSAVKLDAYKSTAKLLIRKIVTSQPLTPGEFLLVDSGPYYYCVVSEGGAVFLAMCDTGIKIEIVTGYLVEIAREFLAQYSGQISAVSRPYPFIKFDLYLQKTKRLFTAGRGVGTTRSKPTTIKKSFKSIMGYSENETSARSNDKTQVALLLVLVLVIFTILGSTVYFSL